MLFNLGKLSWDQELLNIFRISEKMLPEVRTSSSIFGETVKIGKLNKGIPISGIAGDQQAALFGQACFEPGTIKNTYGTGSFVLLNTGKKKVDSRSGLITTIGCDREGKPAYVLEGSIFIAGAAIQWLRDQLMIIKDASETEKLARSINDNEEVYFVPALVGLGAPYWQQDARGMICGITRGTNRAHLVRAALESMCYQTRDVMDAMVKDSGIRIKELKVDGGAVANNFLCQFQADILQYKVIRPKVIETTALGAAYLAGLAAGYWKNSTEIKKFWREDSQFKPVMKKAQADKLHAGWLKALQRTIS